MSVATLKIAVIGGGISGLSVAYYLMQQAKSRSAKLDIHIFERTQVLGGNADTVVVDLGERFGADGAEGRYFRWADLGVNDVNLATYKKLFDMMTEVGYLDQMEPLEDTASFYSADGRVALTDDKNLQFGVSDSRTNLKYADSEKLSPLIDVIHKTALDLLNTISVDYTVGQFFQDCMDDPKAMLSRAAEAPGVIDWQDPALPQRVATIRDSIYYPRISAMYFTDDQGPQGMPLQAPFEYYRIQEGGGKPNRRYFKLGSQTWLEKLSTYLLDQSTDDICTRIHTGSNIVVKVSAGSVRIQNHGGPAEPFDLCVVATHADDARELFSFADSIVECGDKLDAILASVRYSKSYAVCHTHSGCMPMNKNLWRTYNIPVRNPGDSFFPYRINYVVNRHQNDPANPEYDRVGLPQFFVSLVDNLNSIPQHDILDRVLKSSRLPATLLNALPQATLNQMDGEPLESGYNKLLSHVSEPLRGKAWTYFKHNILDAKCIHAQLAMKSFNLEVAEAIRDGRKPSCPLLFGGGWTHGAGLHEQCLEQSETISKWIFPG